MAIEKDAYFEINNLKKKVCKNEKDLPDLSDKLASVNKKAPSKSNVGLEKIVLKIDL